MTEDISLADAWFRWHFAGSITLCRAMMKYPEVRNYVAGNFVKGEHDYLDVYNPSDGSVI